MMYRVLPLFTVKLPLFVKFLLMVKLPPLTVKVFPALIVMGLEVVTATFWVQFPLIMMVCPDGMLVPG